MSDNTVDQKAKNFANGVVGLIFIVILLWAAKGCIFSDDDAPAVTEEKTMTRKEIVEANFSAWDGSHTKLTEYLKAKMNDPESYENIETTYIDRDSVIIVNQTFTGKNGFGGRVRQKVMAFTDNDGNILEVIEADPFE